MSSTCISARFLGKLPFLLWHFTESDFATFVLPNTACGLFSALVAPLLTTHNDHIPLESIVLYALPRVLLFNWANVFVFDLANQRLPESQEEDRLNKPWRPLVAKGITADDTRQLMLLAIPTTLGISYSLGTGHECAWLLILTWLYNDLKGGDGLARDGIIAIGYFLYLSSSLKIAIGAPQYGLSENGYFWMAIQAAIIFTTMQVQDLKDQVGDQSRGRQTLPIVLGDTVSRWSITGFVLFWSIACASFWGLQTWVFSVPVVMGLWVAFHVLKKSNDALAWKYWCGWQVVIYSLPWMSRV
ncbi:uncharacterized protein N7483_013188 [Penicillium malachiteum]|uniref:uncharacterized protein n=1 Tax=Penicillium malachiteum TaxID=1324776 RepID=UPI002547334D|nr:uncharacterized protein N7483_013188 [Penicillium malachiteum]KAJ5716007.1 hypothetical protein N7483_013188 [Penicillium malachiteum]